MDPFSIKIGILLTLQDGLVQVGDLAARLAVAYFHQSVEKLEWILEVRLALQTGLEEVVREISNIKRFSENI